MNFSFFTDCARVSNNSHFSFIFTVNEFQFYFIFFMALASLLFPIGFVKTESESLDQLKLA